MMDAPTVVVADDHPLMRAALRQTVGAALPQSRLIEADSFDALTTALSGPAAEADLVLLDLHMPGIHGFVGLLTLRANFPAIPVIIVSATEDANVIRRAMDYGASGYVPKSAAPADFAAALTAVLAGDVWTPSAADDGADDEQDADLARRIAGLTPQQLRVLVMLTDGKLNKQIAYELAVSEATVKAHVSAILRKLNVNSRTQAVIAAGRLSLEAPAPDLSAPHPESVAS